MRNSRRTKTSIKWMMVMIFLKISTIHKSKTGNGISSDKKTLYHRFGTF